MHFIEYEGVRIGRLLSQIQSPIGLLEHPFARTTPLFLLCSAGVIACLLLGGGTKGGLLSDALLQLISLPLLLVVLWRLADSTLSRQAQWSLGFCLAVVALPLLQLVPLPPAIWTSLPNRELSSQAFALIGQALPWMPLSISPERTWLSALSLIPPVAIFLSVLLLSYRERRWLSLLVVVLGTVGVFLGLAQVAQGPGSSLRFFEFTNVNEAVGFFANRNHFAALAYVLLLFVAAWASNSSASIAIAGESRDTASVITTAMWFVVILVLLAGLVMARSRAGLGLGILALLGAFALGASDRRSAGSSTWSKLFGIAIFFAGLLVIQYGLYRFLERLKPDLLPNARSAFFTTTLEAATSYLPLGSGLGTFEQVYAHFEKPERALLDTYANHAHNDFVQLLLETGILGPLLLAGFSLFCTLRAIQIWRKSPSSASSIDILLARAATLAVLLIALHSAVDYPLRTSAMMSIFALCLALMIPPQSESSSATALGARKVAERHSRENQRFEKPVAASAGSLEAGTNLKHVPKKNRQSANKRPRLTKSEGGHRQDALQSQATKSQTVAAPRTASEAGGSGGKPGLSAVAEAVEMARKRAQSSGNGDSAMEPARGSRGGRHTGEATHPHSSEVPNKSSTQQKPKSSTQQKTETHDQIETSFQGTVTADTQSVAKRLQLPVKPDSQSQLPVKPNSQMRPVQIGSGRQTEGFVKARAQERWGEDVEWPEEWRQTDGTDQSD